MRINLRYFHSSHTLVGKPDLLSRPFRKVKALTVNKRTSIIDANLQRAALSGLVTLTVEPIGK